MLYETEDQPKNVMNERWNMGYETTKLTAPPPPPTPPHPSRPGSVQSRYSPAYPKLPVKTAPGLAATVAATLLLMLFVPSGAKPVVLVTGCCCAGILVTGWLADSVLSKDDGTPAMRAVSDPIKVSTSMFCLAFFVLMVLRRNVLPEQRGRKIRSGEEV